MILLFFFSEISIFFVKDDTFVTRARYSAVWRIMTRISVGRRGRDRVLWHSQIKINRQIVLRSIDLGDFPAFFPTMSTIVKTLRLMNNKYILYCTVISLRNALFSNSSSRWNKHFRRYIDNFTLFGTIRLQSNNWWKFENWIVYVYTYITNLIKESIIAQPLGSN